MSQRKKWQWRSAICACLLIAAAVVFAAIHNPEETDEKTDASGQWKYILYDSGVMVTGYKVSPKGDLLIPSEMGGYPVTGIGDSVFERCGLTSVTIPDTVIGIMGSAR